MADELELELDVQLQGQREALQGIEDAVNALGEESGAEGIDELIQMRAELRAAVAELEGALLEMKRARILAAIGGSGPQQQQPEPAPTAGAPQGQADDEGCPCRFRYFDGRWYAGRSHGPGRQAGTLCVTFEVPTRPFMLDAVDVMEALVLPYDNRTAGGPQPSPQQLGNGSAAGPGAAAAADAAAASARRGHHELSVGRRALAQLPGTRLYVPVELAALDVVRGTASVLPLAVAYGGGGRGPVHVPLSRVTKHAHVDPPAEGGRGTGGRGGGGGYGNGGEGGEGEDDGGSSSSESVDALLRPHLGVGSDQSGDEYDSDDEYGIDEYGEEYEDDDDEDGDPEADLYGEGDPGDGRAAAGTGYGRKRRRWGGGGGDEDLDVLGHARTAAAAGALDETSHLAAWEGHGRGVASRLLLRMGYREGAGLGLRGQGTMQAPEVLLLPERRGLGAVDPARVRRVGGGAPSRAAAVAAGAGKRRSKRGGARAKKKRAIAAKAEARQAAREEEDGAPGGGGLFDFINGSLGDGSAAARIRKAQVSVAGVGAGGGGGAPTAGAAAIAGAAAAAGGGRPRGPPDRRGLMSHHDTVAGVQTKIARLSDMLRRNAANKALRGQIEAQLRAAQAELAAAQSAAARAGKAIADKDAQKKWLKF
ncbi:hypothetical protein HYH03_007421 [Edaphochlamys debaryana]|uniref:G-patch domain-containing protein n=1 Tax=Edaphochlamys debaryana TaxID=47281 RepID=A0A836C0D9_9CHLO|nr:hypothetical protein HYH03_007421 [Edaphochlamys debaryana]|eukprot:KAG2494364.1 hypothetical protein HYH03_007421 [Edaphochlamys debaryana]